MVGNCVLKYYQKFLWFKKICHYLKSFLYTITIHMLISCQNINNWHTITLYYWYCYEEYLSTAECQTACSAQGRWFAIFIISVPLLFTALHIVFFVCVWWFNFFKLIQVYESCLLCCSPNRSIKSILFFFIFIVLYNESILEQHVFLIWDLKQNIQIGSTFSGIRISIPQ